jgi:hypothetical protein
VLKRYVGERLVKTIANPTEEELKEFGYMVLVSGAAPDYDAERQYLTCEYEVVDGKIYEKYIISELPILNETED